MGHAGAPAGGMAPRGPAHAAGIAAGNRVAAELMGPGNRVAAFHVRTGPTSTTTIVDFDTYYVVFDQSLTPPADLQISNVRAAAKWVISTYTVDHFAPGSSALPATAAAAVAASAADVVANADSTVRIRGYTDNRGTVASNITLSGRRARAIQNALVAAGVPRRRTYIVPLGETDFVASNSTEAGRALNRRAEIAVTRPDPPAVTMTIVP